MESRQQKTIAVYDDTKDRLDYYKFVRKVREGRSFSVDEIISEWLDQEGIPRNTSEILHAAS